MEYYIEVLPFSKHGNQTKLSLIIYKSRSGPGSLIRKVRNTMAVENFENFEVSPEDGRGKLIIGKWKKSIPYVHKNFAFKTIVTILTLSVN